MVITAGEGAAVMGLFLEDYTPRIRFVRPKVRPNMRLLLAEVADRHDMDPGTVRDWSRKAHIVRARQEFMYLAHKVHGYSLPHIGQFLGGMDHTTVLHGWRMHLRRQEPGYVPYKPVPPRRKVAA